MIVFGIETLASVISIAKDLWAGAGKWRTQKQWFPIDDYVSDIPLRSVVALVSGAELHVGHLERAQIEVLFTLINSTRRVWTLDQARIETLNVNSAPACATPVFVPAQGKVQARSVGHGSIRIPIDAAAAAQIITSIQRPYNTKASPYVHCGGRSILHFLAGNRELRVPVRLDERHVQANIAIELA